MRTMNDELKSRSSRPAPRKFRNRSARRGSMYLLVLVISTMVVVTGLGALTANQANFENARNNEDAIDADFYARSAIEIGLFQMGDTPDWRTSIGEGTWIAQYRIGRGKCSLTASRVPDGDADPYNDVWLLTATGYCNAARRIITVRLIDGTFLDDWRVVVSTS